MNLKQGVFKYFFVLGFIILLIITYVIFYDKNDIGNQVHDQTSTKSTLITDLRIGIAEFDTLNPLLSNNKNVKEVSGGFGSFVRFYCRLGTKSDKKFSVLLL